MLIDSGLDSHEKKMIQTAITCLSGGPGAEKPVAGGRSPEAGSKHQARGLLAGAPAV